MIGDFEKCDKVFLYCSLPTSRPIFQASGHQPLDFNSPNDSCSHPENHSNMKFQTRLLAFIGLTALSPFVLAAPVAHAEGLSNFNIFLLQT